jgi:hypothetical protein
MLTLPQSTTYGKRIPKQKFYDNLDVTPELKRVFVEQIAQIIWHNKPAAGTLNVAAGEAVTELEVFEVKLNQPTLDTRVLQRIDQQIPYHILYLLTFEGKAQAWIGYKEARQGSSNAFKVNAYYHTEWMAEDALPLRVEGLTLDAVYEGFVRQVAGERLAEAGAAESLRDAVQKADRRHKLEKQIAALEKKMLAEKQFNRKIDTLSQLRMLHQLLEGKHHE